FTDRPARITGRIADATPATVARYSVVVFTVDKSQWLPDARRIRAVPPSTDGSFSVIGLPAGEYAIDLAEDVEPADLADAAFLTRLLRSARTFTLRDGEQVTLDL